MTPLEPRVSNGVETAAASHRPSLSRVWRVAWLGVALCLASPAALGASVHCTGPKCPTLGDGLLFMVKAFVALNVAGALWLIGRDLLALWRRRRHPRASEPADPAAPDSPAD